MANPDPYRARLERMGAQILERPWGDWDAVDLEGNVFRLRGPAHAPKGEGSPDIVDD